MGKVVKFEPMTILSALAAVTKHLGFVATSTTTYNEPYTLARQFASLDLISGGRAGWNLVTSNNEQDALNFGRDEHMSATATATSARSSSPRSCNGLWDSWDEDAFIRDKESGVFYDTARCSAEPQAASTSRCAGRSTSRARRRAGRCWCRPAPSGTGRDVAARLAEIVFTAQTVFEQGKEFYADVMARLPRFGRTPDEVKVMPGFYPVVAPTGSEAQEKYDYLQSLIQVPVGLSVLEHTIGVHDLDQLPLDGPVPEMPDTNGPLSRQRAAARAGRARQAHLLAALPRQCRPARPRAVDRHARRRSPTRWSTGSRTAPPTAST